MSETPDELRARLGALYEIDKRQWWTYARGSRSAFENRVREAWPTIDALLARLATAEADADRLAEAMRDTVEEFYGEDGHTYNPDETECLRLHDEAVARREQP